jgi:hypothetical protein
MVQSAEPAAADPHADPMIPRIGRVVGREQNLLGAPWSPHARVVVRGKGRLTGD